MEVVNVAADEAVDELFGAAGDDDAEEDEGTGAAWIRIPAIPFFEMLDKSLFILLLFEGSLRRYCHIFSKSMT